MADIIDTAAEIEELQRNACHPQRPEDADAQDYEGTACPQW